MRKINVNVSYTWYKPLVFTVVFSFFQRFFTSLANTKTMFQANLQTASHCNLLHVITWSLSRFWNNRMRRRSLSVRIKVSGWVFKFNFNSKMDVNFWYIVLSLSKQKKTRKSIFVKRPVPLFRKWTFFSKYQRRNTTFS